MDSCSPACQLDPRALYEAATARRAQGQQETEGKAALRLIETALAADANSTHRNPLPADATISVRA